MLHNIVLGGGIAGLVASYLLAKQGKKNIVLIETAENVGGLLRSFEYENVGCFDYGTHYFASIYPEEIQELMWETLPDDEWSVMEGVESDVSGIYYNQQLQKEVLFVDIRNFGESKYKKYLGELFAHFNSKQINQNNIVSAKDYLEQNYGSCITSEIFEPILQKTFGLGAEKLHNFAAKLIPLQRICAFDEALALDFLNIKQINSVLAFPKQLNLPTHLAPSYFSYYPKKRGIQKVIDGIVKKIQSLGVKILTKNSIDKVVFNSNKIAEITLLSGEILEVENFVSSVSLPVLANLLNIEGTKEIMSSMDKPKHTIITNIILKNIIKLANHYFYCYEQGMSTFRITNYNAITQIKSPENMPLTVESLHEEILEEDTHKENIFQELKKMGFVEKKTDILFQKRELLKYGFPCLSVKNMQGFSDLRKGIEELNLTNLTFVGALSEENVFFMKDVLQKTYNKIKAL